MTKYKFILINKNSGFTLVEIMVAIIVFALIIPGVVVLLMTVNKGFTAYEAANQLKKNNQETLNRIFIKLTGAKRIFQNNSSDNAYLARIMLSSCPAVLPGSTLPTIEETGTLTPGTTSFIAASVGNSIFFANNDSTQILYNIADSGSSTHTVYIDVYRFYYYYLTSEYPKPIYDKPSYALVEYRSQSYADYNQIQNISDTIKRKNTVSALCTNGITFAWNVSATDVSTAFSTMSATGLIQPSPNHQIPETEHKILTNILTGITGGGYRYGISPNSSGWAKAPKIVPQYAVANNDFPGGFEVVVTGPSAGRKILIRSVLVAQGSMPNIIGDEQLIVCSARDLW